MKIEINKITTIAITALFLFVSGNAWAHSNHDHSTVPYKWEFSKKLNAKIERNLHSNHPTGVIGLTPFEQRKFSYYGIQVGNKFESTIKNVEVTFERTSGGLKVTDAALVSLASSKEVVPIREVAIASRVKLTLPQHSMHDHKRIPVEWVFGESTNSKIVKHMFQGKGSLSVGLTKLEKRLLNEYEIKVGNEFHLYISGHRFVVERTSMGLKIINHVQGENFAQADFSENSVDENI